MYDEFKEDFVHGAILIYFRFFQEGGVLVFVFGECNLIPSGLYDHKVHVMHKLFGNEP